MSSRPTGDRPTDATLDGAVPESVRRLVCLRCTHETHDEQALREFAPADPIALARQVKSHDRVTGAVVLATCNRVEVYASTRTPADRGIALERARTILGDPSRARTCEGRAVVEHLGRVACGLDSRVPGEDHVLGQVRDAFETAADAGLAGGVLRRAADAAVRAGRTARDETAINEGHLGYGTATCEVVADETGAPDRLVLVGAGEMASEVAKAAHHRWDPRIDVGNRSPAPDLPSDDGTRWPLADLAAALADADAVVTATGADEPVLTRAAVADLPSGTPIVDLASPPDVAGSVRADDDWPVTGLAAVQERMAATRERREQAIPAVEAELAATVERFLERERESAAEDTIRALHRHARTIRERELERARAQLRDGDADPGDVLENFASALTGALLADPTDHLREAAREGDDGVIDATHELFDLEE